MSKLLQSKITTKNLVNCNYYNETKLETINATFSKETRNLHNMDYCYIPPPKPEKGIDTVTLCLIIIDCLVLIISLIGIILWRTTKRALKAEQRIELEESLSKEFG